jgi:acyl-CoA thioesterase-1
VTVASPRFLYVSPPYLSVSKISVISVREELGVLPATYNRMVPFRSGSAMFLAIVVSVACGRPTDTEPVTSARPVAPNAPAKPSAPPARTNRPRIIVLGDSLTAGLGLDLNDSFPSIIQRRLEQKGLDFEVVNAGVSGDTSAGGLRRLEWAMSDGMPRILIVALGGNDGLRGLPPEQLEANLASIIEQAQKRGLTVILAGMEAPPNFGVDYTGRFRAVYPTLAKRYQVDLIPFLLEGVAGDPALNQGDGIHPNRRGAERVADLVWKTLEPAIARAGASSTR